MHFIYYVVCSYLQTNVKFLYITNFRVSNDFITKLGVQDCHKKLLDSKVNISECEYDFD